MYIPPHTSWWSRQCSVRYIPLPTPGGHASVMLGVSLFPHLLVTTSEQTWCLTSTETTRLIRDGEKGVWRWGSREIIYLSLHCHHQNNSCIKMGSDESHFNVSVGDGQSHRTVSTNHNLFEEKGEPKRYRTEVLPLTKLTPYR